MSSEASPLGISDGEELELTYGPFSSNSRIDSALTFSSGCQVGDQFPVHFTRYSVLLYLLLFFSRPSISHSVELDPAGDSPAGGGPAGGGAGGGSAGDVDGADADCEDAGGEDAGVGCLPDDVSLRLDTFLPVFSSIAAMCLSLLASDAMLRLRMP